VTQHHLPTKAQERKALPIYSGFVKYFPDAMIAVAELSRVGNDQHNPGKPLHWDRSKSGDELDALMRHLADAGKLDSDGIRHSTKVAWRAMANLQKEIERERKARDEAPPVGGEKAAEGPAPGEDGQSLPGRDSRLMVFGKKGGYVGRVEVDRSAPEAGFDPDRPGYIWLTDPVAEGKV
jgi:hypothetical protein